MLAVSFKTGRTITASSKNCTKSLYVTKLFSTTQGVQLFWAVPNFNFLNKKSCIFLHFLILHGK